MIQKPNEEKDYLTNRLPSLLQEPGPLGLGIPGAEEPILPDLPNEAQASQIDKQVLQKQGLFARRMGLRNNKMTLELPENKANETTASWQTILKQQCPYLMDYIGNQEGKIDAEKLQDFMTSLKLKPCDPSSGDCLDRNCAVLWKYYVQNKYKTKSGSKKRCGKVALKSDQLHQSLIDPNQYDPHCAESRAIADKIFAERDFYQYKPEDIEFLYHLREMKIKEATRSSKLYSVHKNTGDAVLKIDQESNVNRHNSVQTMQYLMLNNENLTKYFVNIYSYQVQSGIGHSYMLMESMTGNFPLFRERYANRDPDYSIKLQQMLYHALKGLITLKDLGFQHNDAKSENLLFKIDWDKDQILVKWSDPEFVTPYGQTPHGADPRIIDPLGVDGKRGKGGGGLAVSPDRDKFAFGILVYEMIFGAHPTNIDVNFQDFGYRWTGSYHDVNDQIHVNMRALLGVNEMQPMATVAYHFIVNERLSQDNEDRRWSFGEAMTFIGKYHLLDELPSPMSDF